MGSVIVPSGGLGQKRNPSRKLSFHSEPCLGMLQKLLRIGTGLRTTQHLIENGHRFLEIQASGLRVGAAAAVASSGDRPGCHLCHAPPGSRSNPPAWLCQRERQRCDPNLASVSSAVKPAPCPLPTGCAVLPRVRENAVEIRFVEGKRRFPGPVRGVIDPHSPCREINLKKLKSWQWQIFLTQVTGCRQPSCRSKKVSVQIAVQIAHPPPGRHEASGKHWSRGVAGVALVLGPCGSGSTLACLRW
jgi:hypothetical protein